MKKRGITLICVACEKEYYVPQSRATTSKYCSRHCQNHLQYPIVERICPTCDKTFVVSNSNTRKKFCSENCRFAKVTSLKETRKRQSLRERSKRKNVGTRGYRMIAFTFKGRRCEICGYEEYDMCLDVHHIDKDVTNNNVENLAVLCCICHRKLHKGVIESPW